MVTVKLFGAAIRAGAEKLATKGEKVAQEVVQEAKPILQKAQTIWGEKLSHVRGNIAMVETRAPWNSSVAQTSFYDLSTTTPTWLGTNSRTAKLDYLPFRTTYAGNPKGAVAAIQRKASRPAELGAFDVANSYKTTFLNRYDGRLRTDIVKTRSIAGTNCERKVMEGFKKTNGEYAINIEPVTTPANGTVRGGVYKMEGNTVYYSC